MRSPARWWRARAATSASPSASFANIFDPDVIVIGGGVSAVGDLLLDPAREELRARALPPMNKTPVRLAELGPDAGMIGAAAMALDPKLEMAPPRLQRMTALMPGKLVVCPTPIGNLEDITLRARARSVRGRRDRLRGHPPHRAAARAARDPGAAADLLPRGQRGRAGAGAGPADRARGQRRARLRRRHAGDLGPRLPADPGLHRPRPRARGPARALLDHHRAGRLRAPDPPLSLPGLPAAAHRRARAGAAVGRDADRLRVAAPAARVAARRSHSSRPTARPRSAES